MQCRIRCCHLHCVQKQIAMPTHFAQHRGHPTWPCSKLHFSWIIIPVVLLSTPQSDFAASLFRKAWFTLICLEASQAAVSHYRKFRKHFNETYVFSWEIIRYVYLVSPICTVLDSDVLHVFIPCHLSVRAFCWFVIKVPDFLFNGFEFCWSTCQSLCWGPWILITVYLWQTPVHYFCRDSQNIFVRSTFLWLFSI